MFVCSSVRLFVCFSARLFIRSSVRLFVFSFVRLPVCSAVRVFVYSCVRVFVCSCARLFDCSFTRLFVYLFARIFVVGKLYYRRMFFVPVRLVQETFRGCTREYLTIYQNLNDDKNRGNTYYKTLFRGRVSVPYTP